MGFGVRLLIVTKVGAKILFWSSVTIELFAKFTPKLSAILLIAKL